MVATFVRLAIPNAVNVLFPISADFMKLTTGELAASGVILRRAYLADG